MPVRATALSHASIRPQGSYATPLSAFTCLLALHIHLTFVCPRPSNTHGSEEPTLACRVKCMLPSCGKRISNCRFQISRHSTGEIMAVLDTSNSWGEGGGGGGGGGVPLLVCAPELHALPCQPAATSGCPRRQHVHWACSPVVKVCCI